jgi:hypothetical protein
MSDSTARAAWSFLEDRGRPAQRPEDEDFVCWGQELGNRQVFSIEFRRNQGTWPAIDYAMLPCPVWCPAETALPSGQRIPSGSILLHYLTGHTVIVEGRNLRTVHEKILRHQVKYLAEADEPTEALMPAGEVVVTKIRIEEPKELRGG